MNSAVVDATNPDDVRAIMEISSLVCVARPLSVALSGVHSREAVLEELRFALPPVSESRMVRR